jgi:hypothetical protein
VAFTPWVDHTQHHDGTPRINEVAGTDPVVHSRALTMSGIGQELLAGSELLLCARLLPAGRLIVLT